MKAKKKEKTCEFATQVPGKKAGTYQYLCEDPVTEVWVERRLTNAMGEMITKPLRRHWCAKHGLRGEVRRDARSRLDRDAHNLFQ